MPSENVAKSLLPPAAIWIRKEVTLMFLMMYMHLSPLSKNNSSSILFLGNLASSLIFSLFWNRDTSKGLKYTLEEKSLLANLLVCSRQVLFKNFTDRGVVVILKGTELLLMYWNPQWVVMSWFLPSAGLPFFLLFFQTGNFCCQAVCVAV